MLLTQHQSLRTFVFHNKKHSKRLLLFCINYQSFYFMSSEFSKLQMHLLVMTRQEGISAALLQLLCSYCQKWKIKISTKRIISITPLFGFKFYNQSKHNLWDLFRSKSLKRRSHNLGFVCPITVTDP